MIPRPGELGGEKPRTVYLAACEELGRRFEPDGFRYLKSDRSLKRSCGEFDFEIYLTTSHWNRSGELVVLELGVVSVWSARLEAWRADQGDPDNQGSRVAGSRPYNLGIADALDRDLRAFKRLGRRLRRTKSESAAAQAVDSFMATGLADEWNLVDPDRREKVYELAEARIREVALPYLAQFEDHDRLVKRLRRGGIASFGALAAVDWLLSHDERDAAIEYGRRVLRGAEQRQEYQRWLAKLRSDTDVLFSAVMFYDPSELAYASIRYGLDF